MFSRNWNKQWIIISLLLVGMSALGSCTRERNPWPAEASNPLVTKLAPTPSPAHTITPSTTGTPVQQATLEPGETLNVTPSPGDRLPPLPGNETLTPEPPTPTPEPTFILYEIKPGDSLYTIAVDFKITVEDIKRYNQLANPNTLRVGQQLKIPQPNATVTIEKKKQDDEGYIHVVKRGETLFDVAQRYSVPLNELAKANGITDPGALRVGQRLRIPNTAAPKPTNTGQRVHIVQPGETLSAIAVQYGVTPKAIAKANGLSNPSRIVSGQKLVIP
ncbi:MAG TPA: LysM peptidoglycan-binding domain-containing protein [Caldilineae bacterium]|nr:LysM peptidoglycan-binding domain-containing protein [Caldilineae bacterium]